jgi:hypothetical protein
MNGPSELYPYPCIRYFHFVSLRMCINPIYSSILEAGKKGGTIFLDIGCCSTTFLFVSLHDNHMGSIMGTDVRKLVYDGYPASSVLGSDLREAYIEAGYKLLRDSKSCGIHFFSSELFDIPVNLASTSAEILLSQIKVLWQLANRVTHLYVGALFHLFDEATQYAIALRMAIVLKRDSGGVIFGRHQGLANEGLIEDHLARYDYQVLCSGDCRYWLSIDTTRLEFDMVTHPNLGNCYGIECSRNWRVPNSLTRVWPSTLNSRKRYRLCRWKH